KYLFFDPIQFFTSHSGSLTENRSPTYRLIHQHAPVFGVNSGDGEFRRGLVALSG
ncbi:Hypothetical predicted protein, partial [Xyrichtys novacula]